MIQSRLDGLRRIARFLRGKRGAALGLAILALSAAATLAGGLIAGLLTLGGLIVAGSVLISPLQHLLETPAVAVAEIEPPRPAVGKTEEALILVADWVARIERELTQLAASHAQGGDDTGLAAAREAALEARLSTLQAYVAEELAASRQESDGGEAEWASTIRTKIGEFDDKIGEFDELRTTLTALDARLGAEIDNLKRAAREQEMRLAAGLSECEAVEQAQRRSGEVLGLQMAALSATVERRMTDPADVASAG